MIELPTSPYKDAATEATGTDDQVQVIPTHLVHAKVSAVHNHTVCLESQVV